MTNVTVLPANHITLTYSGHGRWTATWKRYTGSTARRTVHTEQWSDSREAALLAAELYVEATNSRSESKWHSQVLNTVTISSMGPDRYAVAVTMRAEATFTRDFKNDYDAAWLTS